MSPAPAQARVERLDIAGERGAPAAAAAAPRGWQERLRLPLMLIAPLVVLAGALYFYFTGGRYQSTDDAYVEAAQVLISANISGRVSEIDVRDNEVVQKGAVLFRIEDAPFRIAVQEAQARLASARLEVQGLQATYRQRQAQLTGAEDTLAYQQREYDRQQGLLASGISSQVQVNQLRHALDSARQARNSAREELAAVAASLGGDAGVAIEAHPAVLQARAALDRALLNLSYTVIRAPEDGIAAKVEQLQVGNYINASNALFALISTHDVWVEANFKESQLTYMRPGQAATVKIDSYPGKLFQARVTSLSPGTGAAFSLLPPENATGNWVKVVQRLPVRLAVIDAPSTLPLRAGLSADVSVDTRHARSGLFAARTRHGADRTP
ncbi:MAG TPA: HlyD family secretion protein [Steroidobacteraceae bacterium]|jgi:membrane fusion protein (multidrug efflux system)|nr:HlyD family secretion protein [Steroidobacteraceae bacterium]